MKGKYPVDMLHRLSNVNDPLKYTGGTLSTDRGRYLRVRGQMELGFSYIFCHNEYHVFNTILCLITMTWYVLTLGVLFCNFMVLISYFKFYIKHVSCSDIEGHCLYDSSCIHYYFGYTLSYALQNNKPLNILFDMTLKKNRLFILKWISWLQWKPTC